MTREDKARPRGRPVSGRKTVVQIGLDEDVADKLRRMAEDEGGTLSEIGRKLLLEGMAARKPRDKRK